LFPRKLRHCHDSPMSSVFARAKSILLGKPILQYLSAVCAPTSVGNYSLFEYAVQSRSARPVRHVTKPGFGPRFVSFGLSQMAAGRRARVAVALHGPHRIATGAGRP
jgi:hypothetical protein